MARQLPPLKALRAFEAGARHLSFTLAAQELSVTQTAVSHQVRHLEDWFATPLFKRGSRRLALTEAGIVLYPTVMEALDRIAETAARVRVSAQRKTLTVSVTPTFGSRWLAQRLGRFWGTHPDIDLRLHHSLHLSDLARDGNDAAVRWGPGGWPGVTAERLMYVGATPLCSPKLIDGEYPIRSPKDLQNHVLLHERDYQEWGEWLAAAGASEVDGRRGPILGDPNTIIHSAIEGNGVMIGIPTLHAEDLACGRLVAPFGIESGTDFAYYLVYLPGALDDPSVRAFRDFLIEEVRAHEESLP